MCSNVFAMSVPES